MCSESPDIKKCEPFYKKRKFFSFATVYDAIVGKRLIFFLDKTLATYGIILCSFSGYTVVRTKPSNKNCALNKLFGRFCDSKKCCFDEIFRWFHHYVLDFKLTTIRPEHIVQTGARIRLEDCIHQVTIRSFDLHHFQQPLKVWLIPHEKNYCDIIQLQATCSIIQFHPLYSCRHYSVATIDIIQNRLWDSMFWHNP